jgi:hypothetical protein
MLQYEPLQYPYENIIYYIPIDYEMYDNFKSRRVKAMDCPNIFDVWRDMKS